MLTTLSIISLDQGRIWEAQAVLSEEEAARLAAPRETQNGGPRPPFWSSWLLRLRAVIPRGA